MGQRRAARKRSHAVAPPPWYRYRSAIFAVIFAAGFLGGWATSALVNGRYVAAFARIGSHWGHRGESAAGAVALAIAIAAVALRVWGASYLSAPTVWDERPQAEALVQSGPFAFVRHPLYLGNLLLSLGLGAAAPVVGWAFIFAASAAFVRVLIQYEERGLTERHGSVYALYRASVPSLLPRLRRKPDAHPSVRASLAQGLRSEAFTCFLVLGVIGIFAAPRYGAFIFVACYLVGVLVQRRIEK